MIIELLIFIVATILAYVKIRVWRLEKIVHNIPGRKGLPFIGNVAEVRHCRNCTDVWNYFYCYLMENVKENGLGIVKWWFGPMLIVGLMDPDKLESSNLAISLQKLHGIIIRFLVKGVLMKELFIVGLVLFNSPNTESKGTLYTMMIGDTFNGILVHEGGPVWKELRKPLMRSMSKKSLINNYHYTFVKRNNEFVDFVRKHKCGKEYDVFLDVARCLLDIISETHLGVKTNELKDNRFHYAEHLDHYLDVTLTAKLKYHFYFFEIGLRLTNLYEAFLNSKREMTKFLDWVLDERKNSNNDSKDGIDYYSDFLLKRAAENNLSREETCKELADLTLAGSDTSSVVISSALVFLAMFPEVQETAYREQLAIMGDTNEEPTYEDINAMNYLRMIKKETLRKVASPILFRLCKNDTRFGEFTVPKGTYICGVLQTPHNDPRFWEKPESFYPEHFLPEKEAARPTYAFVPFGGGARVCPGFKYGIQSIMTFLSGLIRNFHISTSKEYEDISYDYKLMLQIVGGYPVKFTERSEMNK